MRGPGLRNQIDVRRLWRCPQCGQERHVPATEVNVHCQCQPSRPAMRLIEGQRKVRIEHPPLPPYFEMDDLPETEAAPETPPAAQEESESSSNLAQAAPVSVVTTLSIMVAEKVEEEDQMADANESTVIMDQIPAPDPTPPGDPHGTL